MAYPTSKKVKERLERAAEAIEDAEALAKDIAGLLGPRDAGIRLEMLDRLRAAMLDIKIGAEEIRDTPDPRFWAPRVGTTSERKAEFGHPMADDFKLSA